MNDHLATMQDIQRERDAQHERNEREEQEAAVLQREILASIGPGPIGSSYNTEICGKDS